MRIELKLLITRLQEEVIKSNNRHLWVHIILQILLMEIDISIISLNLLLRVIEFYKVKENPKMVSLDS